MQNGRLEKIISYLKKNGKASLTELAKDNEVSVDTIRRDLFELEQKGLVERIRGGALICEDNPVQKSFGIRSVLHNDKKRMLCCGIREIVKDGQTIALNNGTTNIEAAKFLCANYSRLNIITNSLEILAVLLQHGKFNVIVPGGVVDIQEKSIYGNKCEADIKNYNIDVALLSVNAISLEKGITDFRFNEIGIINSMLEASAQKYILADASKFESVSCVNICNFEKINGFLTDKSIQADVVEKYEKAGFKLYIN